MGDENPIRTLGDYSKPSHKGYRNTIELPVGNNVVPLGSNNVRLVQKGCSFYGLRSEDPNQHLKDFLKLVDSLDLDGENRERMRRGFLATANAVIDCRMAKIAVGEGITMSNLVVLLLVMDMHVRRRYKSIITTTNSTTRSLPNGVICKAFYPKKGRIHTLDHEDGVVYGSHILCFMGSDLEWRRYKSIITTTNSTTRSLPNGVICKAFYPKKGRIHTLDHEDGVVYGSHILCFMGSDLEWFLVFANQSSSPQMDNEDLEKIDQDDLEEMDLK
nr:MAK10-like protein [Tanacetum cinerariifolium]